MKLLRTIFNAFRRWGWLLFVIEPKLTVACPPSEKRLLALYGWLTGLNHMLLAIAMLFLSQLITDTPIFVVAISSLLFCGISAMYRLLLTTFSSDRLPHTAKIGIFNSSILISFFFLTFITFLVAKPLEIALFKDRIAVHLEDFRSAKSKSFFSNNLIYLDQEIDLLEKQLSSSSPPLPEQERVNYTSRRDELCDKRQKYINEFDYANANS